MVISKELGILVYMEAQIKKLIGKAEPLNGTTEQC
jgi:hypothetical protein